MNALEHYDAADVFIGGDVGKGEDLPGDWETSTCIPQSLILRGKFQKFPIYARL